jgi:succinate dehydrogenase/fumarate reductase flavoprotein subunit
VVRSEEGLVRGVQSLREREARLREIVPGTSSERGLKEDLTSALFVVKAVLTASLSRKESRGAFCRNDFPRQDDANWGASSCLAYECSTGTLAVKRRARELPALITGRS